MATPRLTPPSRPTARRRGFFPGCGTPLLLAATILCSPNAMRASGGYDDQPPPTLPYYLGRLPAKPPAQIFEETFGGPTSAAKPTDFKAALLAMAADCEQNQPSAKLLASTDQLLAQARLHSSDGAALCNLLEDVRNLFVAAPPVTGKPAANYLRWRVDHADWFHLRSWDLKRSDKPAWQEEEADKKRREDVVNALDRLLADPATKPLRMHWLYLRGACVWPGGGAEQFQQVVAEYPDHPRAEVARFMLARCKLAESRSHNSRGYGEPTPEEKAAASEDRTAARALFEDYLKRYPQGRFAADVPGWLGALAFDAGDYPAALEQYIRQADIPGHPEVLKSAGFMCERCLSRLATVDDTAALDKVALHPRLGMSLVYLLVNSPEAANYDGQIDSPAQVAKWRSALLPKLAAAVAAHKDAYSGREWQGRYLAILAQAASGTGDQKKALELCAMNPPELAHSDDLAFVRLVALERARRLPEAIAVGDEFARQFPQSPLARGAALRRVLALVDNHQAGVALAGLYRLRKSVDANESEEGYGDDFNGSGITNTDPVIYPTADRDLDSSRSVLSSDVTGAQSTGLEQIADALLCLAPLPELAAALSPADKEPLFKGEDEAGLREVLMQRWLAEEENFAEAKKYATPAQWSVAAAAVEKLAAEAASAPAVEARATACFRLAEGWAAARGKLVYAPLETDQTREKILNGRRGAAHAGERRRENGLALGYSARQINHALSSRDEWSHAFVWWQKAADAAPKGSPTRARALWAALRAMPAMAVASPYTLLRAGETGASKESRRLYDRLRRECPDSREAREFAVYYDLAPRPGKPDDDGSPAGQDAAKPDLSAATADETLAYGETEYRWDSSDPHDSQRSADQRNAPLLEALKLNDPKSAENPARMAETVAGLRAQLDAVQRDAYDAFLVNFLDDLGDFLGEPAAKLTPAVVHRYVGLRTECMSVAHWGGWYGQSPLPPVPGTTEETLNETVLRHIREAYHSPEMALFKDYLDFLALAVVANSKFQAPIHGETQESKDGTPGKQETVTYTSRNYPKLARLAENFLKDYPHSRKREAARLLLARALYAASRPQPLEKFAVWPGSGHFQSRTILTSHRQEPFDPRRIGAALNAYDREFPHGQYVADIRNLRGLLAWRTQDWALAVDLTLKTLADEHNPVLREDAGRRLNDLFVDGLTDETERARCLAAVKAHPEAVKRLKEFLPGSPYSLRVLQGWLQAQQ